MRLIAGFTLHLSDLRFAELTRGLQPVTQWSAHPSAVAERLPV